MIALQVPLQSQVLCNIKWLRGRFYHYLILLETCVTGNKRQRLFGECQRLLTSFRGCCTRVRLLVSKRQVASVAGQVTGVAEQVNGGCWVSYSGGEQVADAAGQLMELLDK
jgi:hypothetical protein